MSRDAIVEVAIKIADSEGLEAVSIRRVAAALDARPMSLYDHIADKEELLHLMGDAVVDEVLVDGPLPPGWREALSVIARHLYATMVAHPWLLFVFAQHPRFGPNSRRQAKQLVDAASGIGPVESSELWTLLGTINDYVLGHSARATNAPSSVELKDAIPADDMAEVPELATLPDWLRTRATVTRFEAGLEIVLDGIERRIETNENGN